MRKKWGVTSNLFVEIFRNLLYYIIVFDKRLLNPVNLIIQKLKL